MKKIFNLVVLIAIMLCFVQCETNKIGQNGTHRGHAYVDLGLSVKWAAYNVGAKSPEQYGDYFAWGETEPKEYYYWDTYKYTTIEDALIKYNNSDNKILLDPEDDAATANWGGSWRMPTDTEFTELIKQCAWTWTTQAGVNGYKVVGRMVNQYSCPLLDLRSILFLVIVVRRAIIGRVRFIQIIQAMPMLCTSIRAK